MSAYWFDVEAGQYPPPDKMVLTLWDGWNHRTNESARYYNVAYYDGNGSWLTPDDNFIDEPTHWQHLPKPLTKGVK